MKFALRIQTDQCWSGYQHSMMLYSPHGTQRYHQCEQMTLVLETLFNIAFCSFAPCGKTNTGLSSNHQKSMHSCHGYLRYSQKIFFFLFYYMHCIYFSTLLHNENKHIDVSEKVFHLLMPRHLE